MCYCLKILSYICNREEFYPIRLNVSGAKIESEGTETESGRHFKSEMKADYKSTISVGVSYLGFSLNFSLNPAKLMGKYDDYELNFNSYGKRIGLDIIYQDAHNFTGWQERDGLGRADLPSNLLKLKTLNANVYYVFNNRRFSYPAAFTQSYIQRRSAGSLLMALSGQGQQGTVSGEPGPPKKVGPSPHLPLLSTIPGLLRTHLESAWRRQDPRHQEYLSHLTDVKTETQRRAVTL